MMGLGVHASPEGAITIIDDLGKIDQGIESIYRTPQGNIIKIFYESRMEEFEEARKGQRVKERKKFTRILRDAYEGPPLNEKDFATLQKAQRKAIEIEGYHEIGTKFCPAGHIIDGGVSMGREVARETIVVDWEKDVKLRKLYEDILKGASITEQDMELLGTKKGGLLYRVFETVKRTIEYKNDVEGHEEGNVILLGDTIETGGSCRHVGLMMAVILERMIKNGILKGKVYYLRGPAHGWAVYRTGSGEFVVFDVQKDYLGDIKGSYEGRGAQYFYRDHMPEAVLNEKGANNNLSPESNTVVFGTEMEELVLTAGEWKNDKRPEGYTHIRDAVKRALANGIHWKNAIKDQIDLDEWNMLVNFANRRGLTKDQANRIAELSKIIVRRLESAIAGLEDKPIILDGFFPDLGTLRDALRDRHLIEKRDSRNGLSDTWIAMGSGKSQVIIVGTLVRSREISGYLDYLKTKAGENGYSVISDKEDAALVYVNLITDPDTELDKALQAIEGLKNIYEVNIETRGIIKRAMLNMLSGSSLKIAIINEIVTFMKEINKGQTGIDWGRLAGLKKERFLTDKQESLTLTEENVDYFIVGELAVALGMEENERVLLLKLIRDYDVIEEGREKGSKDLDSHLREYKVNFATTEKIGKLTAFVAESKKAFDLEENQRKFTDEKKRINQVFERLGMLIKSEAGVRVALKRQKDDSEGSGGSSPTSLALNNNLKDDFYAGGSRYKEILAGDKASVFLNLGSELAFKDQLDIDYYSKFILDTETGAFYIVLESIRRKLLEKNEIKRERLGYYLGRNRAPITDMEFITVEDVDSSTLTDWAKQNNLTYLTLSRLVTDYDGNKDYIAALQKGNIESLVVFYTFIRDYDHIFGNEDKNAYRITVEGADIYVSFDHGCAFGAPTDVDPDPQVDRIEDFVDTYTWSEIFSEGSRYNIDYDILREKVKEFMSITDEEIRDSIYRAGFNDSEARELSESLMRWRDNLASDLERMIVLETGLEVDLSPSKAEGPSFLYRTKPETVPLLEKNRTRSSL
ncbi:MAG: hypothetical protein KJ706_01670, partial [Candidatus Omnitrophica bacterium]|nr:hypothetical protein [Candidatus Omnitrophota bacterium]